MKYKDIEPDGILEQLAQLPEGNITRKTIRGKSRMYLQWREDGKTKSRYIRADEEEKVSALIERRKALEQEYRRMQNGVSVMKEQLKTDYPVQRFKTNLKTGSELAEMCAFAAEYRERECIRVLRAYISSNITGKVCVVYGLRRTGKTTMILQTAAKLPEEQTAYIKIIASDTMADLNSDLLAISKLGIKYVFIDEVTLMQDFIDSASLLSDVYTMTGMKIILSGTDSLGFAISADEELYDRAIMVHTTFIPFREYSRLLGIHDIDEYIRYGGTFRVGETDFDDPELNDDGASFRDDESTRRYIDTAIARNIQHSLACYKEGGHFRHLVDLYEKNEMTNAVNRIIEDMNHSFLLSVLMRDFKSHDLGSSSQIQRKRAAAKGESSILDYIDVSAVTQRLMDILEIKNRKDLTVPVTEDHIREIREYLGILDLIVPYPLDTIGSEKPVTRYLFSQPGMRYCQAQALVFALMKDDVFRQYPAKERKMIEQQILEEVRGRMLEEIVLLETIKTLPKTKRAFKLQFTFGEYDMVVQDVENVSCEIYEIKHTDHVFEAQYAHLTDSEKLALTEHEYGDITGKTVLYRGENCVIGDVAYKNVVEYLEGLSGVIRR